MVDGRDRLLEGGVYGLIREEWTEDGCGENECILYRY